MTVYTGILWTPSQGQPLSASGQLQAACYAVFYLANTTTPCNVYSDAGCTTSLGNTVTSNSAGTFSPFYLNPQYTYRCQLYTSGGALISDNTVVVPGLPNQANLGTILYPQTAAESSASITPTNYYVAPGNVLRYGTNTTPGTTDMTTAIQDALNQAGETSGVSAYLPAGTYLVSSQLTASGSSRFYGDGSASVINFSSTANADNLVANAVNDFTITNMKLVVTGAQTGNNYVGVVAFRGGATNCVCSNVEFTGVINCGVDLAGASNCRIDSNYFHGFTSSAFTDSSDIRMEATSAYNCQYNVINNNQCFGGNANGIGCDTSGSSGLLLLNKNVYSNNRVGQHTQYGILVYTHISADTYDQIVNNYVENIQGSSNSGQTGTGIYVAGMGAVNVANNVVVNCCVASTTSFTQGGISINTDATGSPCNVVGNAIYDMAQGNSNACIIAGIALYNCGLGTLVANNVVSQQQAGGGTTYIGIYVPASNGGGNTAVIGNNVNILSTLTGTRGIFVFANGAMANITITGNNITGCAAAGIGVQQTGGNTATNLAIVGNTAIGGAAGSVPFNITNAANVTFTGNIGIAGASASACLNISAVTALMASGNVLSTAATYVVVTANACTNSTIGETNLLNGEVNNAGTGINIYIVGTQSPGSGTWAVGDHVRLTNPAAAGAPGYYCTTAGSPGTWKAEAVLA